MLKIDMLKWELRRWGKCRNNAARDSKMKIERKKRCSFPTINNAKDRLLQDIENYCDDKKPSSHNRFPVSFSALIPAHQRRWLCTTEHTHSFHLSLALALPFVRGYWCVRYAILPSYNMCLHDCHAIYSSEWLCFLFSMYVSISFEYKCVFTKNPN